MIGASRLPYIIGHGAALFFKVWSGPVPGLFTWRESALSAILRIPT